MSTLSPWVILGDPSTYIMIAMAVFAIYHGSYRSYQFNIDIIFEKEKQQLPNFLFILMPIIVSISSFFSVSYVFHPFFRFILTRNNNVQENSKKFKIFGEEITLTVSHLIACVWSAGIVVFWVELNSFVFVDILSICSGITALSFLRFNNGKALSLLLWLFLFYDVFWVFISPLFFGKSVMESVATKVMDNFALPLMITVPRFFLEGGSGLGNGDFVLPGVFICQLYFLDKHYKFDNENNSFHKFKLKELGYFKISIIFYILGLLFSFIMVVAMQRGQPALLYLVPFITIPIFIIGYKRGHLGALMKPIPRIKQEEDDIEASLSILSDIDQQIGNNLNERDENDKLSESCSLQAPCSNKNQCCNYANSSCMDKALPNQNCYILCGCQGGYKCRQFEERGVLVWKCLP
eukprot:gene5621-6995_t